MYSHIYMQPTHCVSHVAHFAAQRCGLLVLQSSPLLGPIIIECILWSEPDGTYLEVLRKRPTHLSADHCKNTKHFHGVGLIGVNNVLKKHPGPLEGLKGSKTPSTQSNS